MNQKQRVRLLRRLRKSRNRAAHREQTWEKFVNEGRRKWSNKAYGILLAHSMWHKTQRSTDYWARTINLGLGAKQASPEMLNWAVKVVGRRWVGLGKTGKTIARFIKREMKRPGFARQVLTPQ